ncbi:helix-turn-helix domain-containing protein [Pseudobacteriovorax antillogorgiicola]|uniref:Helix-turn-helix domain-containing protein n=1 Tax=Pseudobacteriovorax antillogorgiicola TaxID=1513793 RepID=A0A1Y6CM17_9BACT|nr:AraC family transcriptional regulator [Pseudobacteriovorax antillogorgiicola]TCS44976.1 helix-turn-helix protein [Pseudobacteriovorax antillogorgiicola]SMF76759.1 Helix-turn-helix domain-containing protein [Pseudobacteriovorax antillogorgiicola]
MDQNRPRKLNQNDLVDSAMRHMKQNISKSMSLDDIARHCRTSKPRLTKAFKACLKITPMKWLWKVRLLHAIQIMENQPKLTLGQICYLAGFNSQAHFSRLFKATYGIGPAQFRKSNVTPVDSTFDFYTFSKICR